MMDRKISFMEMKEGEHPLFVIRYRMPSPNRSALSSSKRGLYREAYFEAWTLLSNLGIRDTTSTILSRKSREEIERAIKMAILAYQKRGLRPPEFTKTSIAREDEYEWVESAIRSMQEKIKNLERKIAKVKDDQRKKAYRKEAEKLKRRMAEIADRQTIEEVLGRL
jgi:hypothetical protein